MSSVLECRQLGKTFGDGDGALCILEGVDFTINSGGIGHVPVILKGIPTGTSLQVQRYVDGEWTPLESVDIGQNDNYQGYGDTEGTLDCVFNVDRPSADLNKHWRLRIIRGPLAR